MLRSRNTCVINPVTHSLVLTIDDCGRYIVSDFLVPALGFALFNTDDAAPNEDLSSSATATAVLPDQQGTGFPLYTNRHTTDAAWTSSAGNPFSGQTFSDVGVFVAIFLTEDVPTNGVVIVRTPEGSVPSDDFYFSDPLPFTRSSINLLQDASGFNGTALMVNSTLVSHITHSTIWVS